jgi:hypothetical protein
MKGEERSEAIQVLQEHLASGANDPHALTALIALRPSGLLKSCDAL